MQTIKVSDKYVGKIRSFDKHQTIRLGIKPYTLGEAYIESVSGNDKFLVDIVSVSMAFAMDLTEDDAREDGFPSLAHLLFALREHYPGMAPSEPLTVIKWAYTRGLNEKVRYTLAGKIRNFFA